MTSRADHGSHRWLAPPLRTTPESTGSRNAPPYTDLWVAVPEVPVVSSEVEARRPGRSVAEALYLDRLVCTVDVGTLLALTCRCGSRRSVERLRLPDLGRSLVLDYRGGLSAPLHPPTRGGARAHQCDRSLRAVNTAARAAARRSAHSPTRFAGTPASPRAKTPNPKPPHSAQQLEDDLRRVLKLDLTSRG